MNSAEKISASQRARWAKRARGPGLKRMKQEAKPGECICCGDPAVPLSSKPEAIAKRRRQSGTNRTHQDTCGAPECKAAWMRYWRRDQRTALQELIAASTHFSEVMRQKLNRRSA